MKNLKDSYSFIEKKQSKEFLMTCPLLYSKQDFDCFSLNIEKALNGKGIVYYFEKKSTYYALKDSFCRAIFRFNI